VLLSQGEKEQVQEETQSPPSGKGKKKINGLFYAVTKKQRVFATKKKKRQRKRLIGSPYQREKKEEGGRGEATRRGKMIKGNHLHGRQVPGRDLKIP